MRAKQKNPKTRAHYEGLTFIKDGIPTFNGTVRTEPDMLDKPLRTRKPQVFSVGWGGDLFHKKVPVEFIEKVWNVMNECLGRHIFLILTKRPKRLAWYLSNYSQYVKEGVPHIYLGTTVENQKQADKRIPELLKCPSFFPKFLSTEGMLGEVDLCDCPAKEIYGHDNENENCGLNHIHQVILGAETGHGARPIPSIDAVRKVRDDCAAAGVKFFFKNFGTYKGPGDWDIPAGRLLDGVEHNELAWNRCQSGKAGAHAS
jgi:protein gp37